LAWLFREVFVFRLHQFEVADADRLGQLVQAHDGRIAPPAFEAAEVLLAESGPLLDLFLGQVLRLAKAGKIAADQLLACPCGKRCRVTGRRFINYSM